MFITATNDRESYGAAGIFVARTAEDARKQFAEAWGQLYDTSTAALYIVNDEDLSKTQIFLAYSEDQVGDWKVIENPDGTTTEIMDIDEAALARLDAALAPHAGT